jgi:hypothetical protein
MGEKHPVDDGARVIALPRRPPHSLGEPPERPPAEVIELPVRDDPPPDRPPRLAV